MGVAGLIIEPHPSNFLVISTGSKFSMISASVFRPFLQLVLGMKYTKSITEECLKYDQRTPKVHPKYAHSMSKECIKYAQSIQIGRSDSNQVLSNSTLTKSNSSTSPYQALLCPKIIINKLIGRAANWTIYILVSYLYQILCNFIFFINAFPLPSKRSWKSLLRM